MVGGLSPAMSEVSSSETVVRDLTMSIEAISNLSQSIQGSFWVSEAQRGMLLAVKLTRFR